MSREEMLERGLIGPYEYDLMEQLDEVESYLESEPFRFWSDRTRSGDPVEDDFWDYYS